MFKYNIQRKNVKNITIRIKKDGIVYVTAPKSVSSEYIDKVLLKKKNWIDKKLEQIKELREKEQKIINSSKEKLIYLGRSYDIKIIEDQKEILLFKDEKVEIHVADIENTDNIKAIIDQWYLEKAKVEFEKFIKKYEDVLGVKVNKTKIKSMKTRWGSCNTVKSYINLNIELIRRPIEFMEYVVLHELCHIKHPNHSREFWDYVRQNMPDYKERIKNKDRIQ